MADRTFDPDVTRHNDAAYWAAALALAIRADDAPRAETAQAHLRRMGIPISRAKPKDAENLLSLSELAEEVGLPEGWLRSEADAERIPHLKAEEEYRFSLRAVREYLARRAAKGGVRNDF